MTQPITYVRVRARAIYGTCLRGYLDTVSAREMVSVFGPSDKDGYEDSEKGYDGTKWVFQSSDGDLFHVYGRGGLHVGAGHHLAQEAVNAFIARITARVAVKKAPQVSVGAA
jgi:hypothetical protein